MIVIMSMVVMMVRAMSRGMRMLTTISTSRLKAARFIFARGNLCRIWFPLWLGPGPLLEKPALLFISLTIFHHCPPTHFWSNLLRIYFQWAGNVGWGDVEPQSSFEALFHNACFQLYLKSWPGVNSKASSSSQSQKERFVFIQKGHFLGLFLEEINFPGHWVDICL